MDITLDIADDDVKNLGRMHPNLEYLVLGPNPSTTSTPSPTLNSLEILASHCDKLKGLALFLDTIQSNPLAIRRNPTCLYTSFTSLVRLNMGMSSLRDEDRTAVARWLGAVCPSRGTKISSKLAEYRYRGNSEDVLDMASLATDQWDAITPLVFMLRGQSTVITAAAQARVRALKERFEAVEESRACLGTAS